MERVGVLLNTTQLNRILARKRTFEKASLYAKAARELGVGLVIFRAEGVHIKGKHVHGYIPTKSNRFQRVVVPIPKVVHKRGLYYHKRSRARQTVNQLITRGYKVYNTFAPLEKYATYRLLSCDPEVNPHLPTTHLLKRSSFPHFQEILITSGEVFIKPRTGTVGEGIVRVRKLPNDRYRYETKHRRITTSLEGAWKLVIRGRSHGFLLQQGIPLARFKGNRYDLRVPVQRGEGGDWVVPGMVAKRAGRRTPFLTNLARGGSAHKGRVVLAESIPGVPGDVLYSRVEQLALAIAKAISRTYPGIADLGLDIGLDEAGKPWFIEANRRDQRYSFLEAMDHQAYRMLFANPIAYGKFLLDKGADDNKSSS